MKGVLVRFKGNSGIFFLTTFEKRCALLKTISIFLVCENKTRKEYCFVGRAKWYRYAYTFKSLEILEKVSTSKCFFHPLWRFLISIFVYIIKG